MLRNTVFTLISFMIITPSALSGVYDGDTDDATFLQLQSDVSAKHQALLNKISEAKALGLSTDYAQVSQTTIEQFKDVFVPWDRAHPQNIKAMYDAKYFSRLDPVGPEGMVFDELADCIEVADAAIAELQQQIDNQITLQSAPNFALGKIETNGAHYEHEGNKVIVSKFFWQPTNRDIWEAFGPAGETYISLQDLASDTTLNNYRRNTFISNINQQMAAERSPIQFFLGHIIPNQFWMRAQQPDAFEKGHRLFTDYDIDNPQIKTWMTTLFEQQLATGVELIGETERVHMIANEPTFSIRENGVNADRGVSSYTTEKYKQWLTNKYTTISNLNTAYASNFLNFNSLPATYTIPLAESLQGTAAWYDWNRFNMDRVNQWFKFLHDGIHAVDPMAKTHVKIMGERAIHTEFHDEGLDFEYITKLVDIPVSDNQTNPFATQWDVRHKQDWRNRYSFEWRAQAIMLDFMKSMAPNKPIYDSEWHGLSGARWRDFHMQPEFVRATLWLAATQGLTSLTTWVWNRKADGAIDTRADFVGTNVTQPIQLDAYGRVIKELNAHGNTVANLIPTSRQYMLYFSQDSAIQDNTYSEKMADVYEALKLLNIPVGFTTPSELSNIDKDTQIVIMPPTPFMSDTDLDNLKAFSTSNGKVVLVDAASSFTKTELGQDRADNNPISAFSQVALSDVLTMASTLKQALTAVTSKPLVELTVVNDNQQAVLGVLSDQYTDSDQQVISLINTSQQTVSVSLGVNNTLVTDITDLITSQPLENNFELKPMAVKLLQVDVTIPEPIVVSGVSLNQESASLEVNGTLQLTTTISPAEATNKNITWISSDTAIATVSTDGKITGITSGSATITVTSQDGEFTDNTSITVNAPAVVTPPTPSTPAKSDAGGGVFSGWIFAVIALLFCRRKINNQKF